MHKEIVINSTSNEVRVALLEEHEVVEFSMERADALSVVGNVYKGKVTAVRPGLQAAFVDIGMEKAGFLHVSDLIHDDPEDSDNGGRGGRRGRRRGREGLKPIESMLKEGDEILVQVTKDVIGTKGPRLTADVSLPGRFMVMMPKGDHVGVSRKIEDRKERGRLKDLLSSLKQSEEGGAFIIRTAAIGIEKKMLERDMDYLRGLWTDLKEKTHSMSAPALVHQDVGLIVGMVRDIFKDDVDSLVVDSRQDYQELIAYVKNFSPELRDRVHFYDGDLPIFDRFGIEAELKKSLDRKVWMKRGGFLVIEQTEALVAIDVNTGRFTGKKNQAETILKTNMLAAKEVARQLRLRDIGGIIVIDFIDMDSEDHKRKVLGELRTHLKRDRSRNKTFGISDLGLVEMSRQRVQESLKDRLSDDCPFCRGSGQVLSVDTLANKVELLLAKLAATRSEKGVQVRANPTLALVLMTERANALQNLSRDNDLPVDVVDDPRLHREEFQILSVEDSKDLVAEIEKSSSRSEPRRGRDSDRRGRSRDDGRGRGRDDADRDSDDKEESRGSRRGSRGGRDGEGRGRGRGRGREASRGGDDRRSRGRDDGGDDRRSRGRDDGGDDRRSRGRDDKRDDRRSRGREEGRDEGGRGRGSDRRRGGRSGRDERSQESRSPEPTQEQAAEARPSSPDPSPDQGGGQGGTSRRRRRRRGRRGRRREGGRADSSTRDQSSSPAASESGAAESRGRDESGDDSQESSRGRRTRRRRSSSSREASEARPTPDSPSEEAAKEKRAASGDSDGGEETRRSRSRRSSRRASSSGSREDSGRSGSDGDSRRSRDDGDSRRSERDAGPSKPVVSRPEDYVRAVPASESDAPPPEKKRNGETRSKSASSQSSNASDTSGDDGGGRKRRRRRRVRRKGIPTRALGKDPKEEDS